MITHRVFELVKTSADFCLKVEDKNFLLFGENNLLWITILCVLKVIFHRHFFKVRDVLDDDPFLQYEIIKIFKFLGLLSFENEKLILLLLIHDKVLPRYDGQKIVILGFLHPDDFILLSCFRFEESDRDLTNLIESVNIKDQNFVALRDKENV